MNFTQPPIVRAGRVFVPLRGVFEQLGASVVYSNGQINATGNGRTISLTIGSTQATVSGQPETMDVAPFIVGATTFVPLRFISQALGAAVNWNDSTSTVTISGRAGGPPQRPAPPPPRPAPTTEPAVRHRVADGNDLHRLSEDSLSVRPAGAVSAVPRKGRRTRRDVRLASERPNLRHRSVVAARERALTEYASTARPLRAFRSISLGASYADKPIGGPSESPRAGDGSGRRPRGRNRSRARARRLRVASRSLIARRRPTRRSRQSRRRAPPPWPSGSIFWTEPASIESALDRAIRRHGPFDTLVHAVGPLVVKRFASTTLDEYREVFDGNLRSAVLAARAILPAMREAGFGRIVFFGMLGSSETRPFRGFSLYQAAKSALVAFARCLAVEEAVQRHYRQRRRARRHSRDKSLDRAGASNARRAIRAVVRAVTKTLPTRAIFGCARARFHYRSGDRSDRRLANRRRVSAVQD